MSVQELLLITLLKKIEEKYGQDALVELRIFADGSGSVCYHDIDLFDFDNVDDLLKQLL